MFKPVNQRRPQLFHIASGASLLLTAFILRSYQCTRFHSVVNGINIVLRLLSLTTSLASTTGDTFQLAKVLVLTLYCFCSTVGFDRSDLYQKKTHISFLTKRRVSYIQIAGNHLTHVLGESHFPLLYLRSLKSLRDWFYQKYIQFSIS